MVSVLAALGCALGLSGCTGSGSADGGTRTVDPVAPSLDRGGEVALTLRGGGDGLEVAWVVARDMPERTASTALAPYLNQPLPIDDVMRSRLEANGLRLVAVPMPDLDPLLASLSLSGVRQRQWFGWALDWREAFRGRSVPRGAVLTIDGERRTPGGGWLRLVARAWTAPGPDGPILRIEFAPQLHQTGLRSEPADDLSRAIEGRQADFDVLGEGRIFDTLLVRADLDPAYAYVLTGEAPEAVWAAGEGDGGATAEVYGPVAPAPPTLGEAMLVSAPGPDERGPTSRALVVFIPRTPDRIRLLPDAQPDDTQR